MLETCKKAAALLAALTLTACSAATGTDALPTATETPAPTAEPTAAPTATPEPGLPYDEIRAVVEYSCDPKRLCTGYFTMSQNGKWGLMRADGTELLPCDAAGPVWRCAAQGHWVWYPQTLDYDTYDAALQASGDGALCGGHGTTTDTFFDNLDAPERDAQALDPGALYCYHMAEPGYAEPMTDALWDTYGAAVPYYTAHTDGEFGDPIVPADPIDQSNGAAAEPQIWSYVTRSGDRIPVQAFEGAGWFFDEALAPVESAGKWAYMDLDGNLVTAAVYDAVCDAARDDEGLYTGAPTMAAHLQNGYAAVCRDGAWGLLDSTGAEVVPCEYAGAAWEGTTLWLKDAAGWHKAEL